METIIKPSPQIQVFITLKVLLVQCIELFILEEYSAPPSDTNWFADDKGGVL